MNETRQRYARLKSYIRVLQPIKTPIHEMFRSPVNTTDRIFPYVRTPYRGVEQLVARRAHNPKVVGSSPAPATPQSP